LARSNMIIFMAQGKARNGVPLLIQIMTETDRITAASDLDIVLPLLKYPPREA